MELDENKIKEIERLKLLFHLPEFWEKEYAVTHMEALRAIESKDRNADTVLVVDRYVGAGENPEKIIFKFVENQKLAAKWFSSPTVFLVLNDGSPYRTSLSNFNREKREVTIKWTVKDGNGDGDSGTNQTDLELADPDLYLSGVGAMSLSDNVRDRRDHSRSLLNIVNDYLNDDVPSVAREIINNNAPRAVGVNHFCANDKGDFIEPALKAVENLERSYLPIQGPPGTGKTFLGSHLVSRLLSEDTNKPRIAIVAQSWEAINNLFEATIDRLVEDLDAESKLKNREILLLHRKGPKKIFKQRNKSLFSLDATKTPNGEKRRKIKFGKNDDTESTEPEWFYTDPEAEINVSLPDGPEKGIDLYSDVHLLATTSWFLVNSEMREACRSDSYGDDFKFDYIFIDEAGQYSLAEALAISHTTKNIVLLGDPKQLPQVVKASHEGGAGLSIMEYLIGKDKNVDLSKGFYLDTTWRMREEVTTYISEQFYDHDLDWKKEICNKREILGIRNGLYFSEVEHEECSRSSKMEAEKVVEIVEDLLTMTFKDSSDGKDIERKVAESDFMVVAPFNEQLGMLTSELMSEGHSGVRVGTVDKFQGQEAPIVIYSLTSSNKEEIPAGRTDFLFMPNRTNVAASRAQCLAVVVGAKDLIDTQPKTIPEMEALNNLCRVFQDVEEGKGISGEWPVTNSVIQST